MELDHRDAALVAGDARPDLVEPTGPRLGEQERVSDVSAGHADEVAELAQRVRAQLTSSVAGDAEAAVELARSAARVARRLAELNT